MMRISYQDNRTLLESQTFLAIGIGVTTLVLEQGSESLNFLLDFSKTEDKKLGIRTEVVNERTLKIVFENWDAPAGVALTEPVLVGNWNKRKLYLYIYVQKAGAKGEQRLITVSFYLGEEVSGG